MSAKVSVFKINKRRSFYFSEILKDILKPFDDFKNKQKMYKAMFFDM